MLKKKLVYATVIINDQSINDIQKAIKKEDI